MGENWVFGQMLESIRTALGYKKEEVYEGLCSSSAYYRFETMERIPDKILFDALLQRLGKSTDWFETILDKEEYEYLERKDKLISYICLREEEKAKTLLDKFREQSLGAETIHNQFIKMIEGIFLYWADDFKECKTVLQEAYHITGNGILYTRQEYTILLMIHHMNQEQQQEDNILDCLLSFCDKNVTDIREKARLYPRAIIYKLKQYSRKENWEEVMYLSKKALGMLGEEGEIPYCLELLEYMSKAYKILGMEKKYRETENIIWAVRQIGEEFRLEKTGDFEKILFYGNRSEYFLVQELFRDTRELMGFTQEEMYEVCSERQYRRIERGECIPARDTLLRLSKVASFEKDFITGYLNLRTFEELDLMNACTGYYARNDYSGVQEKIEKIKFSVKEMSKQSQQRVVVNQVIFERRNNEISAEGAIRKCESALKMTQPHYSEEKISKMFLNRAEVLLLHQIAALYKNSGDKKRAITIRKAILLHYQESKVDKKYHVLPISILTDELIGLLEEMGEFEEAIEICNQMIVLLIQCGKGISIERFLTKKAFTLERLGGESNVDANNVSEILKYYKQAYYIGILVGNQYVCEVVQSRIKKQFGECFE